MKKMFLCFLIVLSFAVYAQTAKIKVESGRTTDIENNGYSTEAIALQKKLAKGWNTWNTRSVYVASSVAGKICN